MNGVVPFVEALLALYLLAGVACAVAASAGGRAGRGNLLFLVLLWPLYGPFLLAAGAGGHPLIARERDLDRALRRVAGTPLARLLPDRAAVRALGRSVRAAAERVQEIDVVLGNAPPGDPALVQLQAARARFAGRLAEVDALLGRLLTQVEVLRLGGATDAPGEELVGELVSRVEALGEMLEDGRRPAGLGAGP